MAKLNFVKKSPIDLRSARSGRRIRPIDPILARIDRRFDNIDENIRVLRKEMNERFAALVDRLDHLTTRVAEFVKRYLRSDGSA
jgi:hypothetical protein